MLLNHQKVRKRVKNTEYTVYFKPTIEFNKSHYKYNEANHSLGLSCLALALAQYVHAKCDIVVIACALVLYLIYPPSALAALGLWVDISGKALVPML